jgi:hypothetical protein
MVTVFEWVTVGMFAALVVLFLQRSVSPGPAKDSMLQYIPPAIGCALANYLGNNDQELLAVAIIAAVVVYTFLVLKPFSQLRS